MDEIIKPVQRSIESLSFEDIKSRVMNLPERFKPAQKYLLIYAGTMLDEILGYRSQIALIKDNPQEAIRRYRKQWESLDLPEEVLAADAPKPEDIPKLEVKLLGLQQEEMDFLKCLRDLEKGTATPMHALLQRVRESYKEGREFGSENGIDFFESDAGSSQLDQILDQAIDVVRKG